MLNQGRKTTIGIIGAGYVGSRLAKALSAYDVIATTKSSKPPCLDATNFDELERVMGDRDVIFLTLSSRNYEDYLSAARAVKKLGKPTIYTSSTSVYAEKSGGLCDEGSPLDENSLLAKTEHTLGGTILRLGGIYSPEKEPYKGPFPGDGSQKTNMVHIDDIIKALVFALEHNLKGVYNLVDDDHMTRREYYKGATFDPSLPARHGKNKEVSNAKIKAAGYHFIHARRK